LTTTIVMFAGSGSTFTQWDRSFGEGVILMMIACLVVLFFDIKGLMTLNLLVIPLLIAGILMVCISFLIIYEPVVTFESSSLPLPVWPSAITYTAFNVMSLVAVLSTLGKQIENRF